MIVLDATRYLLCEEATYSRKPQKHIRFHLLDLKVGLALRTSLAFYKLMTKYQPGHN